MLRIQSNAVFCYGYFYGMKKIFCKKIHPFQTFKKSNPIDMDHIFLGYIFDECCKIRKISLHQAYDQ